MLSAIDSAVVIVYLAVVLLIGLTARLWAPKQEEPTETEIANAAAAEASQEASADEGAQEREKAPTSTSSQGGMVSNYFLAGRTVAWWAVGMLRHRSHKTERTPPKA